MLDVVYDGLCFIFGIEIEVNIRREVVDIVIIVRKKFMMKDYDFIVRGSYCEGFR